MSCEVCALTTNLKSCGSCLKVNYCSREHQIAHWKVHRPACKGITANRCSQASNGLAASSSSSASSGVTNDLIVSPSHHSNLSIEQVRPCINNHESHPIGPSNGETHLPSSTNSNFPPENVQSRSEGLVLNSSVDLNSQICPSMASLQVCDPSSNAIFGANIDPAAGTFSSHIMPNNLDSSSDNRDFVFSNLNTYCQIILKDMNQYGFCVIDNFLQNGEAILTEVKSLYQKGLFQAGQVVNNRANSNTKMIRGDQIIWVEGVEPVCNNIGFLIRILDSIITKCNTTMSAGEFLKYTINRRTKAMIACYPGNNTKYVRHIDNPNSDGRCITSIYYLNQDYDQQKDGGVLRLFPQMNDGIVANIEPKFNRVIFFWSDRRNPHEVMPSTRMRFAITVWYFDANERAKAIQKLRATPGQQCPNDKDLSPF